MKFGLCCSLEDAAEAVRLGADFVELPISAFAEPDLFDPRPYHDLPVLAGNLFFPGSIVLVGPEATEYRDYAKRAMERASQIGMSVAVIGSGGSRRAPFGTTVSRAARRFVEIAQDVSEIASAVGVVVAPEPLNRSETNVGNDLAWMSRALSVRGVAFTADSYHVLYEWDANMRERDPERLVPTTYYLADQIPFRPAHVHLSNLFREAGEPTDPMLRAFAGRLRELGFDGGVSLECRWPGPLRRWLPKALEQARAVMEG